MLMSIFNYTDQPCYDQWGKMNDTTHACMWMLPGIHMRVTPVLATDLNVFFTPVTNPDNNRTPWEVPSHSSFAGRGVTTLRCSLGFQTSHKPIWWNLMKPVQTETWTSRWTNRFIENVQVPETSRHPVMVGPVIEVPLVLVFLYNFCPLICCSSALVSGFCHSSFGSHS